MKNIIIYYIAITAPLVILFNHSVYNKINPYLWIVSLLFYAIIYRTFTDGFRLYKKGIIQKNEIWKLLIPFKRYKYFKELYFTK